jgi:hypothetical protein
MSSLRTLELKGKRVRKALALVAMFFVALAMLIVLAPTKANAQSVVGITVPKGTKIDVIVIGDTGKCQCAEPVAKKPAPKPVVKKYVPKPDPQALVLKSMKYRGDSLSAALRIATLEDSLHLAKAPKVRMPVLGPVPMMRLSADIRLRFADTLVVKHIFVDACPNIIGVQAMVPLGMTLDVNGNCVAPPKRNHTAAWVVGGLVAGSVLWAVLDNHPKRTTTNNYYACSWVNGKQVCPNGGPVNAPNGLRAGISVPFRP